MLHHAVLVALLAASGTAALSHSDLPVAHVSAGTIQGGHCQNSQTKLFQGIPYAQPPVDHLRFMPPQPLKGRYPGGVLNATKPPSACIQWPYFFDVQDTPLSEDCLYLDVYVPANKKDNSSLPVKVWAHGGGNDGGALSLPLYNACALATDAIVVAFNYRLGPLGFLALADAGIAGNMAIQDYIAALTWVKHNIGAFGGDVSKVMLFGQSAGADNTFVVSTLPQARGLISAAVMESGGGMDLTPYETAQYTGRSFAETLQCSSKNLTCLQSKSVEALLRAYGQTPALLDSSRSGGLLSTVFSMNLPNTTNLDSAVLDGQIIKHESLKVGSQVPIIIGQNEYDSTLLVIPYYFSSSDGTAPSLTEANYSDFLSQWGRSSSAVSAQYPLSLFNSSSSTSIAVFAAITHITTVAGFICPGYKALRAASAPAYAYRFNRTLSCPWLVENGTAFPTPELAPYFGSTHTAEIPFLFANMDRQPWGNGSCDASQADRELSRAMTAAWTAMAVRGDPSTEYAEWPRFDACSNEGVYIQDKIAGAELDFAECGFWDDVWAQMGGVGGH